MQCTHYKYVEVLQDEHCVLKMTLSPTEPQPTRPAELSPDDGLYNVLDETVLTFFSEQTGIKDREELKKHISEIRNEAWKVHRKLVIIVKLKAEKFFTGSPIPLHSSVRVCAVCMICSRLPAG